MLNQEIKNLSEILLKNVSDCEAEAFLPEDESKLDGFITVRADKIFSVIDFLKNNAEISFNSLHVISGVDYLDWMEVCYFLTNYDPKSPRQVMIKIKIEDRVEPAVDSIVSLYPAANFQEREVFDMIGVRFNNHPDLRRILCPDDWDGYPLRKDYVASKYYRGMEVYPDQKMNYEDREFKVRQDMIKKAQETKAQ